jgi:DNA-binding NarL/FixJ family response regulator
MSLSSCRNRGPTRVVVVDDDDISRRGMASLLAESPEVSVVAAMSHTDALGWDSGWDHVDVALVDAADENSDTDHFPGVAVVERIRLRRAPQQTMIAVVTGHFFDDAVRRRMREARADFFYHRIDVKDAGALYDAVLRPRSARRGVPAEVDAEAEFCQGVTATTRVNRAVAYAIEHGLEQRLADRQQPRSRFWLRLRREFNHAARLNPVTTDGRSPDRPQELPSLPQIARFLAWATKVKTNHPALADPARG